MQLKRFGDSIGSKLYLGLGAIVVILIALVSISFIHSSGLVQANIFNIRSYETIGEISATSQEQNTDIQLVNRVIHDMDTATKQNAALVEEAAAAAQSLQDQAAVQARLMSFFTLADSGR